ncbi:endoplasmic reticulum [Lynx pardinus]|uniref:Endoplasmic reticulum n=1 Tax=Lynx pardinus TaxID=191816 RepID=A0A485MJ81_LYNPA|nr:endoplasmic reticulum [Lynx pardinus]
MRTYLIAYIVCDFNSVSGTTSSGVKVSVYTSAGKWSKKHYALEASLKLLDFYEHYFGINYPLHKLDLVAIPDFESGAMENWGLITYQKTSLLFDPKTSSVSDRLWVTKVIVHELAHQGACISNILKDLLSKEKFQEGIIHYLKKFSYGNAKNDDLWSSLSNSCLGNFTSGGFYYSGSKMTSCTLAFLGEDVEVKEMMTTWTLQRRIPLIVIGQKGRSLRLQ